MGRLKIDWAELFYGSTDHEEGSRYLGSLSSAPHAAAIRAGPAAAKRARAEADVVVREALCSELQRRVVTRAAAKVAADQGHDAHSAAENVQDFNQEDGQGEHVDCLKSSPVLVSRKKNRERADGDCKCKRVARPSTKNDDKEPAPPEEIFEVLREIPSLERADLLRTYSTLIRDDRLFRSLMVLPKDMRKDWLLMEIENQ